MATANLHWSLSQSQSAHSSNTHQSSQSGPSNTTALTGLTASSGASDPNSEVEGGGVPNGMIGGRMMGAGDDDGGRSRSDDWVPSALRTESRPDDGHAAAALNGWGRGAGLPYDDRGPVSPCVNASCRGQPANMGAPTMGLQPTTTLTARRVKAKPPLPLQSPRLNPPTAELQPVVVAEPPCSPSLPPSTGG